VHSCINAYGLKKKKKAAAESEAEEEDGKNHLLQQKC